jgi:hypothetical protein
MGSLQLGQSLCEECCFGGADLSHCPFSDVHHHGNVLHHLITLKMQHLNENLESVKELPQEQKKEKLVWCVNYHVHIIG